MATQQAYQAYAQSNKGTLVPGQTISVNKYTVQVERYLSQGGFAHVYLVRTPQPVYGTTHHVLKRIAVANEAMLSEVKKEVDVMRVLKGHPNIVHLIDAAWHRMPDTTYEVFILMEFCPGGGIIDMMNRRLRERLTEAEILQIFVDVCEGVAFMHNSRPPLLHRDLKVENILQSSATSYKLCDFGSAATVSRPPTNTQEIRALEADIGRHTTMQYRAPEMIDLYSKRPIDEKSDVWALGVLLYKLCYYTTPFEEHGSLAILNVQYRIPPYPVYSSQMNMLIASMLREHGTQRPSVFELLNHVHYLRGTKSQFTYSIPAPQQPIPARQPVHKPSTHSHSAVPSNYAAIPPASNGSRNAYTPSPQNAGTQAREKVLEAIAPMRRGRPTKEQGSISKPSSRAPSPQKSAPAPPASHAATPPVPAKDANWLDNEDGSWKAMSAQAKAREKANALFDEAWKVPGTPEKKASDSPRPAAGFNDDFAEKLWRAPNPNAISPPAKSTVDPMSLLKPSSATIKPLGYTGRTTPQREKDAFEGLGLMSSNYKPAPTLAEARKLRTGLAIMSSPPHQQRGYNQPDSLSRPLNRSPSSRPSPSPRPSYSYLNAGGFNSGAGSVSPTPSPVPTGSSWQNPSKASPSVPSSAANTRADTEGGPVESRFPSLEEIDAQFGPAASLYPSSTRLTADREGSRFISQPRSSSATAGDKAPQLPPRPKPVSVPDESLATSPPVRSAPVIKEHAQLEGLQRKFDAAPTSTKAHDWKSASFRPDANDTPSWKSSPSYRQDSSDTVSSSSLNPPSVLRPKRSSMTMKYAMEDATATPSMDTGTSPNRAATRDDKYSRSPKPPPQDWLTGDDDEHTSVRQQNTRGSAVLRRTPAKRASVIQPKEFNFPDGVAAQHDSTPVIPPLDLPSASSAEVEEMPMTEAPEESPTVSRFTKAFPPIDLDIDVEAAKDTGVNEALTDNWSPITSKGPSPPRIPPKTTQPRKKDSVDSTSSAEDQDGPEDLGGLNTRPSPQKKVESHTARKRKGRTNSVHDLVDLWGGGLNVKEKPKESVEEKKPQKPRPSSLMPPLSGGLGGKFGIGSGNVSPTARQSRDPSPVSQGYTPKSAYDAPKEKPIATSPGLAASPGTTPGGRSRPQSMFIFPSNKPSTSSEGLNSIHFPSSRNNRSVSPQPPPQSAPATEEQKPSTPVRRTSISNMVQRYEAIGGKVIIPQAVTSANTGRTRKISTRMTGTTGMEHTRVKVFPTPEAPSKPESPAPLKSAASRDDFRPNRVMGLASVNTAGGAREPEREVMKPRTRTMSSGGGLGARQMTGNAVGRSNGVKGDYNETHHSRSSTVSRPSPIESRFKQPESYSSRAAPSSSSPSKESFAATTSYPIRKPTLPLEEVAPASAAATTKASSNAANGGEEEPSSPEKPYQGVGRLIDQWQRKTGAEETKPAPGMVKRAGLVGSSNRF